MIWRIFFIFLFSVLSSFSFADTLYKVFTENGKQGLKDNNGIIVIPPQFEALGWSYAGHEVKNNRIGFRKDGKWGLLSIDNTILFPATLEAIYDATSNYIVAGKKKINGRYKKGLIGYSGQEVIPFKYNYLEVFDTNIIAALDKNYGLIDFQNRIVVPFQYSKIENVGDLRWIIRNEEGKGAVFNGQGLQLTEFILDSIENFSDGSAKAWVDHKVGLLSREGKWLVPAEYKRIVKNNGVAQIAPYVRFSSFTNNDKSLHADSIKILENGLIHTYAEGNQWILDKQMERVSPVSPAVEVQGDLAALKVGNLYKIFNLEKKKWWSDNFYKEVIFPNKALVLLKDKNTWTLMNVKSGVEIISGIEKFSLEPTGIKIQKRNAWGWISLNGREILPPVYEEIKMASSRGFIVRFHGAQGIISGEGEWLLPPVNEEILAFSGQNYISFDGINYNLNSFDGKKIYFSYYPLSYRHNYVEEQMDNGQVRRIGYDGLSIRSVFGSTGYKEVLPLKEGLIGVYYQGMYGFIDPQNRLRIANRYEGIQSFNEGIASVKIRGKWGAINMKEKLVVQPLFDSIGYFRNGKAVAMMGSNFGMINNIGDVVLTIDHDAFTALDNDFFYLKKKGKVGVANSDGRVVIWPKYDSVEIKNGYFVVAVGGKFGMHDIEGIAILPPVYEQIIPVDEDDFLIGKQDAGMTVNLNK